MFLISEESCSEELMISGIQANIDEQNKITLTWEWPRSRALQYCVVFALEEDIPLDEIIRRKLPATVYEDEFGLVHTMELEKQSILFKVYPAKKISNRDFELINQVVGNTTDVLRRRVTIAYSVKYKKKLLSSVGTATLSIRGLQEVPDEYVVYRCKGEGRSMLLYPIDINKFGRFAELEIPISGKEEIELVLTERQQQYIELKKI